MRTNAFSVWVLWFLTMTATLIIYRLGHPELAATWMIAGTAILFACSLLPLTIYSGIGRWFADTEDLRHTVIPSSFTDREELVDPWKLQQRLMAISDQKMADKPMVTREVILYYALIMEEVFEMGTTLLSVLARTQDYFEQANAGGDAYTEADDLTMLHQALIQGVRSMGHSSTRTKELMKAGLLKDWVGVQMHLEEARRLFDDTTDVQVVNSGFCLAAGLPGPEGYLETQTSNLSKANPTTGKIDKTADGKWIKGVNYQEPDLERVLMEHFPWLLKDLDEQPIISVH